MYFCMNVRVTIVTGFVVKLTKLLNLVVLLHNIFDVQPEKCKFNIKR